MYIDHVQTNKKLYDIMWSPLRVLAVKRNSNIEDELGKRTFKKMPGHRHCIKCGNWPLLKDADKDSAGNWYCKKCLPWKGREHNRFGKAEKVEGQKKVRLFHSLHEYN